MEKKEIELRSIHDDCDRVRNYDKLHMNEQATIGLNKELAEIKDFVKKTLEESIPGHNSD